MSKMSQLHAELSEQASRLGFQSIEEAETNGYEVDYEKKTLVDGRELAHEAWVKEREEVLGELISVYNDIDITIDYKKYIKHAIDFIKKGEA